MDLDRRKPIIPTYLPEKHKIIYRKKLKPNTLRKQEMERLVLIVLKGFDDPHELVHLEWFG